MGLPWSIDNNEVKMSSLAFSGSRICGRRLSQVFLCCWAPSLENAYQSTPSDFSFKDVTSLLREEVMSSTTRMASISFVLAL